MVRELLAVVARAALQWALASLLLANGAAFCLIAAAASWLRLGPPCLLCAGVHRLLCSAAPSHESAAFRRLLCDAHVAAIAAAAATAAAPEPDHEQRRQQRQQRSTCSASDHTDREIRDSAEAANLDKTGGLEAHRVVSIGSEICEQDHDGDHSRATATAADGSTGVVSATASTVDNGDGDDPYVSLFELAPIVAHAPPPADDPDGHGQVSDDQPELQRDGTAGEERERLSRLVAEIRAQRRELEALRAALDGERRARAEAAEYQRQLEEQGEFDREAVRLAMQLVHETETEKHGLQRQLDACRVKAQLYEASMDHGVASPPPAVDGRDAGAGQQPEDGTEANGDGGSCSSSNNYQSLVDFLPGSVFSSSPDLATLLKLYTEGNGGRRLRDGSIDVKTPADIAVVAEEVEDKEQVAVEAVAGRNPNGNVDTTTTGITIAGDSSQERSSDHLESTEFVPLR